MFAPPHSLVGKPALAQNDFEACAHTAQGLDVTTAYLLTGPWADQLIRWTRSTVVLKVGIEIPLGV